MAREALEFSSDPLAEDLAPPVRYDGIGSWVLTGFVLLFMAGFVAFRMPGVMKSGSELSVERAVFASVNALTLTGFQQTIGPDQYRRAGHVTVYVLTLGGTILSLVGGAAAVARIIRLPFSDWQIIAAAVVATGVATIVGGALIVGAPPFEGVFAAASAFGNSGLLTGPGPRLTDVSTWTVLLPLAFVGGIGLTVLMELYAFLVTRRPISKHARVVVAMSAGAFIAGTLLLAGTASIAESTGGVARGGALALDARTAGIPFAGIWPASNGAKGLVAVLMLIGAGSAGAAGGIKVTTVYELFRGTRRTLAGEPPGRAFGIAVCFVLLFFAVLGVGVVMLSSTTPQLGFDSVVMLGVSAITNCGLSQDPVSVTGPGTYVLCGLMIVGRLLPLAVLWWMADTTRDADIPIG